MWRFRCHSCRTAEMPFCKVRRVDTKVLRRLEIPRTRWSRLCWCRRRRLADRRIPESRRTIKFLFTWCRTSDFMSADKRTFITRAPHVAHNSPRWSSRRRGTNQGSRARNPRWTWRARLWAPSMHICWRFRAAYPMMRAWGTMDPKRRLKLASMPLNVSLNVLQSRKFHHQMLQLSYFELACESLRSPIKTGEVRLTQRGRKKPHQRCDVIFVFLLFLSALTSFHVLQLDWKYK